MSSVYVPKLNLQDVHGDDCVGCFNGGGKGAVMQAGNNNWTSWVPLNMNKKFRRDTGLCGDKAKDPTPRNHEVGGRSGPSRSLPYVRTYKSGSVIEMTADIRTNHNGFFEFFICDATKCGGDISEDCFRNGHCHQLLREKTPKCESQLSPKCGPRRPRISRPLVCAVPRRCS